MKDQMQESQRAVGIGWVAGQRLRDSAESLKVAADANPQDFSIVTLSLWLTCNPLHKIRSMAFGLGIAPWRLRPRHKWLAD